MRKTILLPAMLALIASDAHAQDSSPTAQYATGIGMAVSQSHAMADVFRDVYTRGEGHGTSRGARPSSGGKASARPALPSPIALSRLRYRPTPETTKAALDAYIARARQSDPRDAEIAYRELSRHDLGAVYRGIVGPFGLGDDNAADSFTALTVLGWMIVNRGSDPSPAAIGAARTQFAPALAANPVIGGDPLAAGEEYKLTFVIFYSSWQNARKSGGLPRFSDGVARMFAERGMDLRGLDLTPAGFRRRG